MVLSDGRGVPLGVHIDSATPAENKLIEKTLTMVRIPRRRGRPKTKVKRIIADKGYDDDPLRWRLWNRGIELISPYRSNNKNRVFEDGRKLRRYKRRYIIERTNSWLKNFRRVTTRWDRSLTAYTGFVRIACICITLMKF
jgi:transposase